MFTKSAVNSSHKHFLHCANNVIITIEKQIKNENTLVIDTEEIFGRFIAESIAIAVLGSQLKSDIEINKIQNVAKQIENNSMSFKTSLKLFAMMLMPSVSFKLFSDEVQDFFKNVLNQEDFESNVRSGSILQMLMETESEILEHEEEITAQLFMFLSGR